MLTVFSCSLSVTPSRWREFLLQSGKYSGVPNLRTAFERRRSALRPNTGQTARKGSSDRLRKRQQWSLLVAAPTTTVDCSIKRHFRSRYTRYGRIATVSNTRGAVELADVFQRSTTTTTPHQQQPSVSRPTSLPEKMVSRCCLTALIA